MHGKELKFARGEEEDLVRAVWLEQGEKEKGLGRRPVGGGTGGGHCGNREKEQWSQAGWWGRAQPASNVLYSDWGEAPIPS